MLHWVAAFDAGAIEAICEILRDVTRDRGPLWGFVDDAWIGPLGVLATSHRSDVERVMRTDLPAPIAPAKRACRGMLRRRDGRVVAIASTGHELPAHATSEVAPGGFVRLLGRALGRMGLTVNCVAPVHGKTEEIVGLDAQEMASTGSRAPSCLLGSAAAGTVAPPLVPGRAHGGHRPDQRWRQHGVGAEP